MALNVLAAHRLTPLALHFGVRGLAAERALENEVRSVAFLGVGELLLLLSCVLKCLLSSIRTHGWDNSHILWMHFMAHCALYLSAL